MINFFKIKLYVLGILLIFSSCKETLYTENGMGGAVKSSDFTLPEKQNDHQVAIKGETKEVSMVSNLAVTIKQSIQYEYDAKSLKHQSKSKFKGSFRKLTKSLKQGLKLIPKVKSMNRQEVKQTLKNQKKIFGYEGDNNAMTIGFNIILLGLLFGVIGGIQALSSKIRGENPLSELNGGCLVVFCFIMGAFFLLLGGLIWFIGFLVSVG